MEKNRKEENVILLNMSRMSFKAKNYYCSFNNDEQAFLFDGISQLEPCTKNIVCDLLKAGKTIDRIIVTCSPETMEYDDKVNMSDYDFYKARIMSFITGEYEMPELDQEQDGYELLDEVRHSDKTDNRDLLCRLESADIENNRIFLNSLHLKYKDFDSDNIKYIKMKGLGTHNAETISDLKKMIMGDADFVNVYINIQGGDRTFTYVLNAILALLDENEVEVKRAISTAFFSNNIVSEIIDNTDSFQLVKLITALKAFTSYGRGDLLVDYFNGIGYKEDSDTVKFVSYIQGITDALQISDPAGLTRSIDDLSRLVSSKKDKFEDPFLNLVAKDITEDFGNVLRETGIDTDEMGNEIWYLDIIDWCIRKGFIQQGLTFIEDKMPAFFMNEKVVTINCNKQKLLEDSRCLNSITKALPYETDINRMKFKDLFREIKTNAFNDYRDLMNRQMAKDIADQVIPESLDDYLDQDDDNKDIFLKQLINDCIINQKDVLSVLNIDVVSFALYEYECFIATGIGKYKTIYETITGQKLGKLKIIKKETPPSRGSIAALISKRNKIEDRVKGFDNITCSMLRDTKQKELCESIQNLFCDDSILSREIRSYLLQSDMFDALEHDHPDEIRQAYSHIKEELTIKMIKANEKDAYANIAKQRLSKYFSGKDPGYVVKDKNDGFISIWIENDEKVKREYADYIMSRVIRKDEIDKLFTEINKLDQYDCDQETALRQYIAFRNAENQIENSKKYLCDLVSLELLRILSPKFERPGKQYGFSINDKFYDTWAGFHSGVKYKLKDSKTSYSISGEINKKLSEYRDEIDLILELHNALKLERNNSNHASEKGLRLNVGVVKYMMKSYVDLCRKYIISQLDLGIRQ